NGQMLFFHERGQAPLWMLRNIIEVFRAYRSLPLEEDRLPPSHCYHAPCPQPKPGELANSDSSNRSLRTSNLVSRFAIWKLKFRDQRLACKMPLRSLNYSTRVASRWVRHTPTGLPDCTSTLILLSSLPGSAWPVPIPIA